MDFVEDWQRTTSSVTGSSQSFPGLQVNFIIGGNAGAYSSRHVDAAGFGTVVHVRTGVKIWFLLFPNTVDYPDEFKDATKDPRTIDFHCWKVRAVRLCADDVL